MAFSDSSIESAREYAAKARAANVIRVNGVGYFAVGSAVGIANVLDSLCDEVERLQGELALSEEIAIEQVMREEEQDASE